MNQLVHKMIQGKRRPDLLIVGAGIFGLWAARHAIRAGKRVMVVDKRRVGAGASGGFMGALMPHMPDRWNGKKQLQFDALNRLEDDIGLLEADTGIACGYRRCGRLLPLKSEDARSFVAPRIAGAKQHWRGRYRLELVEQRELSERSKWLDPSTAPFGAQWDNLTARVNPRAYLAALAAFTKTHGELHEETEVVELLPTARSVVLASGEQIGAAEICVAAGWEAYELLLPIMGPANDGKPIGRGVKGQALLLDFEHGDREPVIFHDGVYVVPHGKNRVAVGSTSTDDWQKESDCGPADFDPADTGFHSRACDLAPALKEATVVEQWANVRPRNMLKGGGTEPFIGPVPGYEGLSARLGGFKIGLGIAAVAENRLARKIC